MVASIVLSQPSSPMLLHYAKQHCPHLNGNPSPAFLAIPPVPIVNIRVPSTTIHHNTSAPARIVQSFRLLCLIIILVSLCRPHRAYATDS
ncbi:protein of unknown function [Trichlorobacter ammonificans]|uniref:Uncharacterized protein n=1 Tax=Trichlorobacter ammonificans TaxID=2916410 RepID=A0ABM9DD24_9BACT|nr:protein of unknown function [Trichlorobacter ammonificans]